MIGTKLAHYEITSHLGTGGKLLGEGGMGAVYEAEQDQPRRSVALKVIKAAWASAELVWRFEQESQALGRLHHRGIAQVYDAGMADTGFGLQPFFAMQGWAITRWQNRSTARLSRSSAACWGLSIRPHFYR